MMNIRWGRRIPVMSEQLQQASEFASGVAGHAFSLAWADLTPGSLAEWDERALGAIEFSAGLE